MDCSMSAHVCVSTKLFQALPMPWDQAIASWWWGSEAKKNSCVPKIDLPFRGPFKE